MRVAMINGDEPYLVLLRRKQDAKIIDFCLIVNKTHCDEEPFDAAITSQCSEILAARIN